MDSRDIQGSNLRTHFLASALKRNHPSVLQHSQHMVVKRTNMRCENRAEIMNLSYWIITATKTLLCDLDDLVHHSIVVWLPTNLYYCHLLGLGINDYDRWSAGALADCLRACPGCRYEPRGSRRNPEAAESGRYDLLSEGHEILWRLGGSNTKRIFAQTLNWTSANNHLVGGA